MSKPFNKAALPPRHLDPKHQIEGFDPLPLMEKWAATQVRSLKRGVRRRQRQLSSELATCRPGRRCGVVPCHVCFRKMRRVAIPQVVVLLEGLGVPLYKASLVSAKWVVPLGELTAEKIREFGREFDAAISQSPLRDAVIWAAWDWTVHVDRRKDAPPHWQPHLYGVIATNASKRVIDRAFLSMVQGSDDIPIPKQVGTPSDLWRTVNYSLKTKFKCRERRMKDGEMNTVYDNLHAAERRELAVVLRDLGMSGRLFLRGIKRIESTFTLDDSGMRLARNHRIKKLLGDLRAQRRSKV